MELVERGIRRAARARARRLRARRRRRAALHPAARDRSRRGRHRRGDLRRGLGRVQNREHRRVQDRARRDRLRRRPVAERFVRRVGGCERRVGRRRRREERGQIVGALHRLLLSIDDRGRQEHRVRVPWGERNARRWTQRERVRTKIRAASRRRRPREPQIAAPRARRHVDHADCVLRLQRLEVDPGAESEEHRRVRAEAIGVRLDVAQVAIDDVVAEELGAGGRMGR